MPTQVTQRDFLAAFDIFESCHPKLLVNARRCVFEFFTHAFVSNKTFARVELTDGSQEWLYFDPFQIRSIVSSTRLPSFVVMQYFHPFVLRTFSNHSPSFSFNVPAVLAATP